MNLGNIKNNITMHGLLRSVMALIFISAGLFRIFNPDAALIEIESLGLSSVWTWPIIVLEVLGGTYLLLKGRYWKQIVVLFIIFLIISLIIALSIDFHGLLQSAQELFVFNVNPTDFFLHVIFAVILVSLLIYKK